MRRDESLRGLRELTTRDRGTPVAAGREALGDQKLGNHQGDEGGSYCITDEEPGRQPDRVRAFGGYLAALPSAKVCLVLQSQHYEQDEYQRREGEPSGDQADAERPRSGGPVKGFVLVRQPM